MTNKLPATLAKKRDELASEWALSCSKASETNVTEYDFAKGFTSCAEMLLPEIEKLTEAAEIMRRQSWGKHHAWAGQWTTCTNDDCVRNNYNIKGADYAFGGNWYGDEIECPECRLTKALANWDKFKEGE